MFLASCQGVWSWELLFCHLSFSLLSLDGTELSTRVMVKKKPTAVEMPLDRFLRTPLGTRKRIASPWSAASDPQNKARETCRHNTSVISGKELALRIRFRGPCVKI